MVVVEGTNLRAIRLVVVATTAAVPIPMPRHRTKAQHPTMEMSAITTAAAVSTARLMGELGEVLVMTLGLPVI